MASHKLNDKEILDVDQTATYSLRSKVLFLKYFDYKIRPNYFEERKEIYKEFINNNVTGEGIKEHNPYWS